MSYLYLIGAIIFEVFGTILLPVSKNFTKPLISIILIVSYMISFYLLTFALKEIPIAIAYSTWAGVGIFLITLLGYLFYNQSLQWQSLVGLLLIAAGVSIVNTFKNQEIL
ncbi:MAG: QacE family quaternary ammonium compound efflux SMR transporter [Candidatus Marinimicrobia bacterium]|nr:QacE family quaternary ammonium compound efflux SMR transporter [Candidatus Neomarinimicrobiota bacterium]|tara:strand:+ start:750 stop:1079 length:330 start_codon:yes stop_codon:yes gene_type:complete